MNKTNETVKCSHGIWHRESTPVCDICGAHASMVLGDWEFPTTEVDHSVIIQAARQYPFIHFFTGVWLTQRELEEAIA